MDPIKLNEMKKGIYDMRCFIPNRHVRYEDVPEFRGPIEVVQIPGKGRGIKATEDIARGQLVIVSRAVEIIFDYKKGVDSTKRAVIDKLTTEPGLRSLVYELYAGKEFENCQPKPTTSAQEPSPNDNKGERLPEIPIPPLDTKRIGRICDLNGFGSSLGPTESRGLWILPSYINHNCIDFNCCWEIFGDLIFIRATMAIKKDEDLLFRYADSTATYQRRLKLFEKNYEFKCECRLCVHQRVEDADPITSGVKSSILRSIKMLSITKNEDVNKIQEDIKIISDYLKEFEKLGVASGRPEFNFPCLPLIDLLERLYKKTNNLEGERAAAEKYYQVVNGCAQKDGKGTICLDIEAALPIVFISLILGDFEGALKWIGILKKDFSNMFGEYDVLRLIHPNLCSAASSYGIDC